MIINREVDELFLLSVSYSWYPPDCLRTWARRAPSDCYHSSAGTGWAGSEVEWSHAWICEFDKDISVFESMNL